MNPRAKSAFLWGVVGGLCFPVLTTGYRLAVEPLPLGIGPTLLVGAALGLVVAVVAYAVEHRLVRKGRT